MASSATILAITFIAFVIISTISPASGVVMTYEDCLRLQLSPPLPPPDDDQQALYIQNMKARYCRSFGRGFYHAWLKSQSGKLPTSYMEALCNVLGDDEKVTGYVRARFPNHDLSRLVGGRTCEDLKRNNNNNNNVVVVVEQDVHVMHHPWGECWGSRVMLAFKRAKTTVLNYVMEMVM